MLHLTTISYSRCDLLLAGIHISYCTESIGEDACKLHNSCTVHQNEPKFRIIIESLLIASDRIGSFF